MTTAFDQIPEAHRDAAAAALAEAFGFTPVLALSPVLGGGSGALAYRIDVSERSYLLRLESGRVALRNPHQYSCMQIASDAGIAPPLRYCDATKGIAIMDFVRQVPLQSFPDGARALIDQLGTLARRLQETPVFPHVGDYPVVLGFMLQRMRTSGAFATGLLDAHAEAFARLRAAYRWDGATLVSSHNDPNPRNILYDGERLWLVDWETAYRNDPMIDVAIFAENFAATPELEVALLTAWRGAPDRAVRARLALARVMTRLYYACLIFSGVGAVGGPVTDLRAPTWQQFAADAAAGKYKASNPETIRTLGMIYLASFLDGMAAPEFEEALKIASG
jgi:aminoglycoside phosphotransferase (APT) family kinase protein